MTGLSRELGCQSDSRPRGSLTDDIFGEDRVGLHLSLWSFSLTLEAHCPIVVLRD